MPFLLLLALTCSQGKFNKNFNDAFLFTDGIFDDGGVKLFNLLDNFPVIKRGFEVLDPIDFNLRLNNALSRIHPVDITGSLRATQFILLDIRPTIQSLLLTTSSILERLRTGDSTSYSSLMGYLEKVRHYRLPVLRGLIPISAEFLVTEYQTKGSVTLQTQVVNFANEMKTTNVYNLITKGEDLTYKGLFINSTFREGTETLLNGLVDSSIIGDLSFRTNLVSMAYSLGDMMYKKAGFSDFKSAETVFKELIVNLEKYYTSGGSGYSSEYSDSTYPSEFQSVLIELYGLIKKLVITPTSLTKDSTCPSNSALPISIAHELLVNLALFDFTTSMTDVDSSLKNLIRLDFKGKDRTYTNNGSITATALESLFYLLSIVDSFGYTWEDTVSCSSNTGCTNHITGYTGGAMAVGDTLWSLQSVIRSDDTFNFKNILKLSSGSRNIFKNNIEVSTNNGNPVDINAKVLRLLETESIGATNPITNTSITDNVYTKTVPWVMNWIKRVMYQGYGPYYNKNKKDAFGNIYAPDGSIYYTDSTSSNARYKSSWTTGDYKICLEKSGNIYRWIGLGGRESDGSTIAHPAAACSSTPSPPSSSSWYYTVSEIAKTDSERAVDSDEEAFYKNFQWLMYEKRFVVVIPARAKLHSSVPFEEGLFIIAIGNGLKGMMGLKPNCGPNNSLNDCGTYNGVWNSDVSSTPSLKLKTYSDQNTDLQTFSSVPGDSVLMLEGWGYGSSGTSTTLQTTLVLPTLVYNLLIPSPADVKGLIPPAISQNFDVFERLGFLNSNSVPPSSVNTYWSERNKITPLVVALAKALDDQVDVANNKNPHSLLSDLSKLLARPFFFNETTDYVSSNTSGSSLMNPTCSASSCKPLIPSVRMVVTTSNTYGIRTPKAGSSDFYPNTGLRSLVSILIENNRRYQDGALNLLSKTDILTGLTAMAGSLGKSEKKNARQLIFSGLIKILGEIKVTADSPTSSQFDLQTYITEVRDRIATYPDSRSSDLSSSDWDNVSDSVYFLRDYLSRYSGYSLVRSMDFALGMVSELPPSSTEISSVINLLGKLMTDSSGAQIYRFRTILTVDLPDILLKISPFSRNLYALVGNLGAPGSYISFLEDKMSVRPYLIRDLFWDLERFCTSSDVQSKREDETSLLFASGKLIKVFADIYEFGKKLDPTGFPFADNLNVDENGVQANYWNRLNMILSSK
ncbi:MAG: hypothetical protein KDK54_19300 [Leptospiraceae bacterium]|nr:hypothetical protein [Leptospiraceae bacterium]